MTLLQQIRGTLRYKLLSLVLFPILLIMPIALVMAIVWGTNATYDQLYLKVNTDLSVSHDVFQRIQQDYLGQLSNVAESYDFRTALDADNRTALQGQLMALKQRAGLTYMRLLDRQGISLGLMGAQGVPAKPSPSLDAAESGTPRSVLRSLPRSISNSYLRPLPVNIYYR